MIDVKQAVAAAIQSARTLYEDTELVGLDLEEVELSEDERYWYITLGFYAPDSSPPGPFAFLKDQNQTRYDRKYKQFKVDAHTGDVRSMKMRLV